MHCPTRVVPVLIITATTATTLDPQNSAKEGTGEQGPSMHTSPFKSIEQSDQEVIIMGSGNSKAAKEAHAATNEQQPTEEAEQSPVGELAPNLETPERATDEQYTAQLHAENMLLGPRASERQRQRRARKQEEELALQLQREEAEPQQEEPHEDDEHRREYRERRKEQQDLFLHQQQGAPATEQHQRQVEQQQQQTIAGALNGKRLLETSKETAGRALQAAEQQKQKRLVETLDGKAARLQQMRESQSRKRLIETPEEAAERRRRNAEGRKRKRRTETPEEKAARLQQRRESQSRKRLLATPEQRNVGADMPSSEKGVDLVETPETTTDRHT